MLPSSQISSKRIARGLWFATALSLLAPITPALGAEQTSSAISKSGFSAERISRIRPVFQAEVDANRMPGAVILIARDGKIVYSDAIGFQDKESGKPLKRDAIFRAASMTKPLVSVLAMMMVEEGKLQLADPVSKFFPAFEKMEVYVDPTDESSATVPARRQILIHDLLRHTSGLTYVSARGTQLIGGR